ncbi:MAG: hypothetical protein IJX63_15720 [Lachnospiraceae bacterium]|nr:hypothetical protein [Lachnospiraceae bacterium]
MKKWKKLLLDNWGLKLISLTIAFALWFVVISIDDPVDDKTFNNIKVKLVNTELITDENMVYEVLDGTDILRSVTFEAPKSIREKIEIGDIVAEADLNELTTTDTVPISFSCPKYSKDVTNISGNIGYVKLDIEEKASKWIDITYNLVGEVAEGYVINSINLDQNRLEIEGPASKIAEVSRAVVDVNVAGISNNMSTPVDIHLKNSAGAEVKYSTITKNADQVKVSVVIYATKEVPVEYSVMGTPAEGYEATGETLLTPETVVIAGTTTSLNNVSKITIPASEVDITNVTGNFEKVINLRAYLPSGIVFADKQFEGKAYVTVYVEPLIDKELEITTRNLEITTKPENMIINYASNTSIPEVVIRGLQREVDLVEVNDVYGSIDILGWMEDQGMTTLASGTYQIPVDFEVPEYVEQVGTVRVAIEFITPEDLAARAIETLPDVE